MDDTCGAKTRAGTPCRQKATYWNGRCKYHGGLATGPTTEAGKEQSRINGRKGGRPRKDGGETQHHGEGNKGVTQEPERSSVLHAAIVTPIQESEVLAPPKLLQITAIADAQVSARVLSNESILEAATDRAELAVPVPLPQAKTQIMDTDKSVFSAGFSGEVLPKCERCTMFAGSGACLAVAKGVIPSMPTAGDCPGFTDFETA